MTTPPPTPRQEPPAIEPADQSAPIPVPQVVKRWLPMLKTVVPPLVALIIAITDARTGKHEVSEKTDTAYETLAPKTNGSIERINHLEDSVKKLADAVEVQGRLLLSMQPGFTTTGTPAPLPTKPPTRAMRREKARHATLTDPALVKKVQTESVKTAQDIKQRAAAPAPIVAPAPPTIPSQPPPALPAAPTPAPEPPK